MIVIYEVLKIVFMSSVYVVLEMSYGLFVSLMYLIIVLLCMYLLKLVMNDIKKRVRRYGRHKIRFKGF